jgi:hypothetical protein
MKRPFASKRPIGPLADKAKDVIGVSGTPFPNRSKNPMVIIYKLDGDNPVFVDDFTKALQQEVSQTVVNDFNSTTVDYKRKGRSSKADFAEPAVILRVSPEDVPFNDTSIHRVGEIIGRIARTQDIDLTVSGIIIEQE